MPKLIQKRFFYVVGDRTMHFKDREDKYIFFICSYTFEEGQAYGSRLENGTWIGMVGQVSRQVHRYPLVHGRGN